jgi:hypothetical protein
VLVLAAGFVGVGQSERRPRPYEKKGVPFSAAAWDFLDTREGLSRVTRKVSVDVDVDVNVKPRCMNSMVGIWVPIQCQFINGMNSA